MKILKPDTATVLYRTLRFGSKDLLSIGTLAMFKIDAGALGVLIGEAELWKNVKQALGPGEVLDLGFPKPSSEWLAYGDAYAPDGKPLSLLSASIEIGSS